MSVPVGAKAVIFPITMTSLYVWLTNLDSNITNVSDNKNSFIFIGYSTILSVTVNRFCLKKYDVSMLTESVLIIVVKLLRNKRNQTLRGRAVMENNQLLCIDCPLIVFLEQHALEVFIPSLTMSRHHRHRVCVCVF